MHEYREREIFGVNRDFPGRREPYFIDGTGRRCAVAYLLDGTGFGDLTHRIAADANHGWIVELVDCPEMAQWLESQGLTWAEAARIQYPGSSTGRSWEPSEPPPQPPDYDGPRDGMPAGGSTSPVGRGGRRSSGVSEGGAAAGAVRPARAELRGIALSELGAESWADWWRWNRRRLLAPRTWGSLTHVGTASDARARAREHTVPMLRQGLGHADARIRAAAVLALGRVAGGSMVAEIQRMLGDSSAQVRETAVLALGAAGSPAAVHELLHLAHRTPAPAGRRGGAYAQPLAVLALGVASRTDDATVAPLIARLMAAARPGEQETVSAAAMAFARLVRGEDLRLSLRALVADADEDVLHRARAAESLLGAADRETIAGLTRAASTRSVDVRRSAALALGRARHPLALPALLTAFELEKELLTRAFALVAIGCHGGPDARGFLLEQMDSGRKPLRVWAGLGLGLLCREEPQPAVGAAIRVAARRERNRDLVGGWFVAMGLARDTDATEWLVATAREEKSSLARAGAVEGLALGGDPRALPQLRSVLSSDPCPFVRGAAADGLGHSGDSGDAGRLAAAVRRERDPAMRSRIAAAMGALGTEAAWHALRESYDQSETDPALRAGVLRGLGGLLAREPDRVMPELSSLVNYTLFPDWLAWALQQDV